MVESRDRTVAYQRIEGLAIFILGTWVYLDHGFSVILYLLLLLGLDIFMIGYLVGQEIGGVIYNLGYMMLAPAVFGMAYLVTKDPVLLGIACVWFAHSGLARALGCGLKISSFTDTHLGRIGRR